RKLEANTSGNKIHIKEKPSWCNANLIADGLLIAIPLFKLWNVGLPKVQRRLVLSGFTASILTIITMAASTAVQFVPDSLEPARGRVQILLSHLEVSISLLVCNALVTIAYFYVKHQRHSGTSPITTFEVDTKETSQRSQAQSASSNTALSTEFVLTDILDGYTTQSEFSSSNESISRNIHRRGANSASIRSLTSSRQNQKELIVE
ncbi:hypothetical protein BDQ12DRAFT_773779, partial [Crucibulum laeve]